MKSLVGDHKIDKQIKNFDENIVSKIVLNSRCVFVTICVNFGSLLEPFWDYFLTLLESGVALCWFWEALAKNLPKNHLRISTSILDRFLTRFGTIWGLKIHHKLSKYRLRSYKRQKSTNLSKPQFTFVFSRFGNFGLATVTSKSYFPTTLSSQKSS